MPSFFSSGVTNACLYFPGNLPPLNDKTTNLAIIGANESIHDLTTDIGILSSGDYLAGVERISLWISSTVGGGMSANMEPP